MRKYISMLRGINVSGQKKVKMSELSTLYESLGFENVATYIQSGNVIFESESNDLDGLKEILEKGIEKTFGFHSPVIIRSKAEWTKVIDRCPFKITDPAEDGGKYLVTFLTSAPNKNTMNELFQFVAEPEQLVINGKEVYLHCPNGYGKSKLSNTLIEKKLGVVATTRNWNTLLKLRELSNQ